MTKNTATTENALFSVLPGKQAVQAAGNKTMIIAVTKDNIDDEHICCAIGNDKENKERAQTKKAWLI